MSPKMLLFGILLLACGVLMAYVEFSYPYILFGLGLGGPLAWGSFLLVILLGAGFVYGSFGNEMLPTPAKSSDILIDEQIDIEGEEHVDKEFSRCKEYFDSGERLLAIIVGRLDGRPERDRLALTDRRVILYSHNRPLSTFNLGYDEIDSIKGTRGRLFTNLGEIRLVTKNESVRFRRMQSEYVGQIIRMVSAMIKETESRSRQAGDAVPTMSQPIVQRFCPHCGRQVEQVDEFCRTCGTKLR